MVSCPGESGLRAVPLCPGVGVEACLQRSGVSRGGFALTSCWGRGSGLAPVLCGSQAAGRAGALGRAFPVTHRHAHA